MVDLGSSDWKLYPVFVQHSYWSFRSFCLIKKNQKIKKIRTASPHATAPPRIFFLPAPGCFPVILNNRFVKNLVSVLDPESGFNFFDYTQYGEGPLFFATNQF
jgi:hypothetical protein